MNMIRHRTLKESWDIAGESGASALRESDNLRTMLGRCVRTVVVYGTGFESEAWKYFPVVDSPEVSRHVPLSSPEDLRELEAMLAQDEIGDATLPGFD